MKKLFCLIFLFLTVETAFAQKTGQTLIDSLQTALKTVKEDSTKVNILNGLSEHAGWRINDNDAALDYARKALSLAKKIDFKNGAAKSYNNIANAQAGKRNYQEAFKNYTIALKIYKETGNKHWEGRVHTNIAITYDEQADYPKAISHYKAALKVAKEIGDQFGIAHAISGIGFIQSKQGKYPEALENNHRAVNIYKKIGNKKETARVYSNIGEINTNKGDFFEALSNHSNALEIYKELNFNDGIASSYTSIGYLHNLQGNYPEALKNHFKSLKIYEQANNKAGIAYALGNIGVIYSAQGNFLEALKNNATALKIFEEIGDKNGMGNIYGAIGMVYEAQKDYPKSLENYTAALKIFEEIGFEQRISACYSGIGSIHHLQGNYQEALKNHFAALKIAESLGDKFTITMSFLNIGSIYLKLNRAEEGKKWLQKGKLLSLETGAKQQIKTSYEYLAKADSILGDYHSALLNYQLFTQYKDSLYNEENTKQLTQTSMQYEFDKKEAIAKAEQEKRATLAAQKLRGEKNIRNGFIGGFGVMMLFAGIFWRQRNKTKKAQQRAEHSEQVKQQFLANMSHEIRTPMNAIIGMTNLVLEAPLDEKQRNYLTSVQKASGTLLHIINEILDLSKIEAGKMELEEIDFSVQDIVGQVVNMLNHKANEKGIEILSSVSADVPGVLIGDPVRLYQVLMNLSGNAVKFTDKGSVQIDVTKISENENNAHVKFSVIDTGIGIPAHKLTAIFESFSQAHSSDTRKYGGTGLGLTISKQFIRLMGGELKVESELGSGTTFSFELRLPLGSKEKLTDEKLSEQIDGNILNGLNILLVDDNEDNRIVARDTLESRADLYITEAVDGKDALEKLENKNFDIILMDVQMPVMDGYEATQNIRNNFPYPKNETPVIALTASVIRSDLDKCREAGMNDYIPKPFKVSQLFSTIAKHTGRELKFIQKKETEKEEYPPQPAPQTDLNYLSEFCEGNPEKMQKYMDIFLNSAPVLNQKLEAALKENNFEEIASQVHGYKTKFIMMGMNQARELAVQIEISCRREIPERDFIQTKTPLLINMISEGIQEIKNRKKV